jgi:hypothetical protein
MQCVVRVGEEIVFALHDDGQDLSGLYAGGPVEGPDGTPGAPIPAGEIVRVPHDFRFAYTDTGQMRDPRRWAGEGSTPIG